MVRHSTFFCLIYFSTTENAPTTENKSWWIAFFTFSALIYIGLFIAGGVAQSKSWGNWGVALMGFAGSGILNTLGFAYALSLKKRKKNNQFPNDTSTD